MGALIASTYFVVTLVFTGKVGYKAVCAKPSDMRDNICFLAVGQISFGIIALGQVAMGVFALGQAAVGIAEAYGMGAASFGRAGGMITFGGHVLLAQLGMGLWKTEFA